MTTQNKRKDDELEVWAIVGGVFTLFLLIIDFFYSSVNQMAGIARIAIWIGHGLVSFGWIISLAKWKDPAYDDVRKGVVYLCIVLSIVIGIHHATVREDKQVLEDSHSVGLIKNDGDYIKIKWYDDRYTTGFIRPSTCVSDLYGKPNMFYVGYTYNVIPIDTTIYSQKEWLNKCKL